MSTCTRCHRSLKNPVSQKLGFGPICASRRSAAIEKEKNMSLSIPPKSWPEFDYKKAAETIVAMEGDEAKYTAERGLAGVTVIYHSDIDVPVPHVMYHSPTGFEYGYGGSGPADLARSILAHAVGLPIADALYQHFKSEYVAAAEEMLSVSLSEIRTWVVKKLAEMPV